MRSYLPRYEMRVLRDLGEALELMATQPGEWKPFAGGTDLMVLLEQGKLGHRKFLSIARIAELHGIEVTGTHVTIGTLITYSQLQRDSVLQDEFPLLCRAASWTGSIANQNRGTLGGNIVNASPAADSPPALLAYDAELTLISTRGSRTLHYRDFHLAYKETALEPDELLHSITISRNYQVYKTYIRKVGPRNAQAISKVAIAAVTCMNKDRKST